MLDSERKSKIAQSEFTILRAMHTDLRESKKRRKTSAVPAVQANATVNSKVTFHTITT